MFMKLNVAREWIPLAFVITALCGLVYVSAQQVLRQSANDPQVQLAEDLATLAGKGVSADQLVPTNKVDMAASLAPFAIIYDEQGKVLTASVQLDGGVPQVPAGVLDSAKAKGENRLTWQPRPGVRSAIVVSHFSGTPQSGYVLVGRSLREVEVRVQQLELLVLIGWLVTLAGAYILLMVLGQPTTSAPRAL